MENSPLYIIIVLITLFLFIYYFYNNFKKEDYEKIRLFINVMTIILSVSDILL